MEKFSYYLKRCVELGEEARRHGESPVGSVIVSDNKIIGEGREQSREQKDISRHAEMVAILDAVSANHPLEGATLFTNVEPCILCSYAIRHYRIKRVVFIKYSGELGGTAAPLNVLTNGQIKSWGNPPEVVIFPEDGLK